MKKNKSFSWFARVRSFGYAISGIKTFIKEEHNALLHLAATVFVIILGFVFSVSTIEAALLALTIGFVWIAELFNTAIEKIMDFISEKQQTEIKNIKDISAAAVLVAAITAFITGCIVFIPKLLKWLF